LEVAEFGELSRVSIARFQHEYSLLLAARSCPSGSPYIATGTR
jgi:hypothetical protein